MAQGTYPRDSISLEEWGKSQEKGDGGGANPVAQLSRDLDQTFRKNILVVTHFLLSPVCQTCGTLRTSPWLAGLRGKDRWGGAGPPPPTTVEFPRGPEAGQQASGLPGPTSLGRGGATCCSTWSSG